MGKLSKEDIEAALTATAFTSDIWGYQTEDGTQFL